MKVTNIRVGFGVSVATGDKTWIKASADMEVELDNPNDTTDDAYEGAWNRVVSEVNKTINNFDVVVTKKA